MEKNILRQQAEEKLGKQKSAAIPKTGADTDTLRLVHELQVHQIELEMQNEELVRARAEVEAALGQYTELYDFAPVGYFTLTRDGSISRINLAGANLLGAGVERGKLINRRFGVFVPDQSRTILSTFLDKVFTSGKNEACEIELLNHGAHAPLWAHLEAITDSDERETCRLVVVDISERKEAELKLKEIRWILEEAERLAHVGSWDWNFITNASYWSDELYQIYGRNPKEGAPTLEDYLDHYHPDDRDKLQAAIQAAIAGEKPYNFEYRILRYDNGEERTLHAKGEIRFNEKGTRERLIGSVQDISERKRAESKVKFQADLLGAVGQAVIATDMAGTVIYFNQAAAELYAWTVAEAMGRNIMDINVPDLSQAEAAEIMKQLNAGKTWSGEFMVKRRDGTIFPAMVSDSPVINGAGQLIAIIGISTDVTERVQAEQKLAQYSEHLEEMVEERTRELREAQAQLVLKEKLAVLGQLASGMGHELRNPLSVINSAVYYLSLVQPDADDKVREYHGIIKQEAHNIERIINDLLDFERAGTADPEPVLVPELVQRVLERHPAPPSVKVTLEIPADLPKIYADSRQMEQTLGYLVVNAYQSMKDGGELVISSQGSVISEQKPLNTDQRVLITIKDSGTGITPENMQRIFEPLFTTKSKGLGLGLPISKKFVEANDGRIEVQSEFGKGSTFTVYLPAYLRKAG